MTGEREMARIAYSAHRARLIAGMEARGFAYRGMLPWPWEKLAESAKEAWKAGTDAVVEALGVREDEAELLALLGQLNAEQRTTVLRVLSALVDGRNDDDRED